MSCKALVERHYFHKGFGISRQVFAIPYFAKIYTDHAHVCIDSAGKSQIKRKPIARSIH